MAQSAAEHSTTPPLLRPIESLAGVGTSRAKEFRRLGVATLGDLLEFFPRDYQSESSERRIHDLVGEQIQTARGEVVAVDYLSGRSRPRFEATIEDGTGKLGLMWFNSAFLRRDIHPGKFIRVQGMVRLFHGIPQMIQPRWETIEPTAERVEQEKFRAIYPASVKLKSETIADVVEKNLDAALEGVEEWFDPKLLKRRGLIGRMDAYRLIHCPANLDQAMRSRKRLIYDELMLMQIGLGLSKRLREGRITAPVMRVDKVLDGRIRARFPFELTAAQQKVVWEIVRDLQGGQPMNRLLQGDVGSGKTVVAVYAMLVAVANRMQAALLAPTEVLAEQHYLTLSRLLAGTKVSVELFTSRSKRRGGKSGGLADGTVDVAVGTQALLQPDIEFANLGLVVVDEQHKLGVRQRAQLKSKGFSPHYLVMTATPIPRTLALSYFADFDVSAIDELPPGRQPIQTKLVRAGESGKAFEFVRKQVAAGRQAYVVFSRIDDDGMEDAKSVLAEFDRLNKGPLAGLRLAALHGQMNAQEKQATMVAFREGSTDVLVATTVIEVGIDVPNATVMLIGDAERFGLSQLHQLRGRVGRGTENSYCLLMSDAVGEPAQARLSAMTETSDGFEIAEMDLKLRGPGAFFGTRQHGLPEFKLADVTQEMPLLAQAKEDALEILQDDPKLESAVNQPLRRALADQIGPDIGLAQVG
jgi:ATP-dependent DNA helicase RecG